jgi:acetoin utilization protein AcuC
VHVVPRTWTHLLAEAAGHPIDPLAPTPSPWRDYVARRTGVTAPEHMTEGEPAVFRPFESGYDPGHPVDRAIMATRNAVFPFHGLMPL